MFESWNEEIKTTEGGGQTGKERLVRYLSEPIFSVLAFSGLYLGTVALE